MKNAIIFGGIGFIGTFFARHLIEEHHYEKLYLYDHESISDKVEFRKKMIEAYPQIEIIKGDVRKPINFIPPNKIDLVANFAAVHREPGHEDFEYYECNLLGAENVCNWADNFDCEKMIFSSSIAPYGPSEEVKDELSIPVPTTPYGGSKLAAEKIHQIWQAKDHKRQLVIIRPGVVFGPGEGGNVSRLIKAVCKGYFVYMGNRDTCKSGIYVKELCLAIMFVLQHDKAKADGFSLVNMSMNPSPSIEEYVNSIARLTKTNSWRPNLPSSFLFIISYFIDLIAKPLRIKHPFSPTRIKKLIRSNNILPSWLIENGYSYKYTLDGALKDWLKDSRGLAMKRSELYPSEPTEAFPYTPPTDEIMEKYAHIFEITEPLPQRFAKLVFDKLVASILLAFSLPILLLIKIAYVIEGLLLPENKGPMLFYYWGVSGGKKIKKWKLRLIKTKYIEPEGASRHDWIAFSAEWTPESRTVVGSFVKTWYLDELPQFWSVLIGDMSIVGPRPLSVLHFERDRMQGNVTRSLLKGGLLGLGHINKGTSEMGNSIYEYEYINHYQSLSSYALLKLDLWIIWKGVLVIIRGGGH